MALSKTTASFIQRACPLALAGLSFLAALNSKGKDPEPARNSAKFLFLVDTSSTMNRYDHSGRQTVFDLIFTGIGKQMQSGDTFGLWTFNEQVSAGTFPMQIWDADQNLELATRTGVFLKNQHYTGKPHAEKAIETALALVKTVKDVNVFVITSGDSSLGTSDLEKTIKDLYQQKAVGARKKNLPIVLAFSTWKGEIGRAQVAISGEPIILPAELLAKARARAKPLAASAQLDKPAEPAVPRARAQPIFMKGEKPAPKIQAPPEIGTAVAPSASPEVGTRLEIATGSSKPVSVARDLTPIKTVAPTTSAQASAPDLLPKPITVAAREPAVAPSETARPVGAALAFSTPPKSGIDSRWVMFAGSVFFSTALVLAAWIFYRVRASRESSFISRSMAQR
jgi:hypothetical protein